MIKQPETEDKLGRPGGNGELFGDAEIGRSCCLSEPP